MVSLKQCRPASWRDLYRTVSDPPWRGTRTAFQNNLQLPRAPDRRASSRRRLADVAEPPVTAAAPEFRWRPLRKDPGKLLESHREIVSAQLLPDRWPIAVQ